RFFLSSGSSEPFSDHPSCRTDSSFSDSFCGGSGGYGASSPSGFESSFASNYTGRGTAMMRNKAKALNGVAHRHRSRFENTTKAAESLRVSTLSLRQSDPRHCPYPDAQEWPLGIAIDIEEVAALLGCSVWTVRQKYLPQGLPYLRASVTGKLV